MLRIFVRGTRVRRSVAALIIVEVLSAGLSLGLAALFRDVIDFAALSDRTLFASATCVYILLVLAQVMMRAAARHLSELSKCEIENVIKQDTIDKILKKQYFSISQYPTGGLVSRIVSDSEIIASSFVAISQTFASSYLRTLGAILMLAYFDIPLIWPLLILMGISLLTGALLQNQTKQYHEQTQEADAQFRSFLQELLTNLIPIKTFSIENRVQEQAGQRMLAHKEKRMHRCSVTNFYLTAVSFYSQIGRIIGILWCGLLVYRHESSIGTMMAVVQLISMLQQSVSVTSGCLTQYHMLTASEARIYEITCLPDESIHSAVEDEPLSFHRLAASGLCFSYQPSKKFCLT